MVSLVDIVPQKRSVSIGAGELELRGLGLRQIAYLFLQFPILRNWFTEGAPQVELAELVALIPDAASTVIAEAADQPEAAEAIASGIALSPDEAVDCLFVIFDLTFPRGAAPLLEKLKALMGEAAFARAGRDQVTNGRQAPRNSSPPDMLAAK